MGNFPKHVFPSVISEFIEGLAYSACTEESFVSVGVLAASAVVSAGSILQVKTTMNVRPNLFLAIVAPKGHAKSPCINAPLKMLSDKQADYFSIFLEEKQNYKESKESMTAKEFREHGLQEPSPPHFFITNEATVEGVKKYMMNNETLELPAHILYCKDELNAFFGGMNKYRQGGKGDDMEFFLSAWDGNGIAQTNSGDFFACKENPCSVVGSIQPGIFKRAFDYSCKENGLFDRFIFVVHEGMPQRSDYTRDMEQHVFGAYQNFILELHGKQPINCALSPEQKEHITNGFCREVCKIGEENNTGVFKKWEVNFYRLALNLAYLHEKDHIDSDILGKAQELSWFFIKNWLAGEKISDDLTDPLCAKVRMQILDKLTNEGSVREREFKQLFRNHKKELELVLGDLVETNVIEYQEVKQSRGPAFKDYSLICETEKKY